MQIKLAHGDITKVVVDVVVNAANSSLLGGGGVDGAIHRVGGKAILEECIEIRNRQGGCRTGEAVITTAGALPAKKVIHTVGPVWNGGQNNEAAMLKCCYLNSLILADKYGWGSIAFPNISTGIYRFPKELASRTAIEAVRSYKSKSLHTVLFVCFEEESFQIYEDVLKMLKIL